MYAVYSLSALVLHIPVKAVCVSQSLVVSIVLPGKTDKEHPTDTADQTELQARHLKQGKYVGRI